MPNDVDLERLSTEEKNELFRLTHTMRPHRRKVWRGFLLLGSTTLTFLACMATTFFSGRPNDFALLFLVGLVLYIFGICLSFVVFIREFRRAVESARAEYLNQIGYASRSKPCKDEAKWVGNYVDYDASHRSNHLWYEGHSELNWQDRELAQSMGMDVQTYVNNVVERE